jgi:hypothetical protein
VFLFSGGEDELSARVTRMRVTLPTRMTLVHSLYIAASKAAKEVVWIRNFLMALGMIQGASYLLNMYCDNNDAIVQANDSRQHKKNKYILMRYHLIR